MNLNYTSRFMGYDIYNMTAGNERAFISTYQDMGYVKGDSLVILSPQQKAKMYKADLKTGANTLIETNPALVNEAISWYQGASFLYTTGGYRSVK